jgi:homoserine kinase type II
MSVYTHINQQRLEQFLALYSKGILVNFSGIKAGIENTNYRVRTTQGEFILTLFESLSAKELPRYLNLLSYLCQHDFPAPQPQKSDANDYINVLKGKPVVLFNCLPGESILEASIEQCAEVGIYLAKLHISTVESGFNKKNRKDLRGCQSVFDKINPCLSINDSALLKNEMDFQLSYTFPNLPQGIIHADLFRDNVLFEQGKLSGMVDFYNACHDCFIYDIAITINDWCVEGNGINGDKFKALIGGYQRIRLLSQEENQCLKVSLRLAALRFCLSRFDHQINPREGEMVLQKDPVIFRRLLEFHRHHHG